jgi:hypothetical protein
VAVTAFDCVGGDFFGDVHGGLVYSETEEGDFVA